MSQNLTNGLDSQFNRTVTVQQKDLQKIEAKIQEKALSSQFVYLTEKELKRRAPKTQLGDKVLYT